MLAWTDSPVVLGLREFALKRFVEHRENTLGLHTHQFRAGFRSFSSALRDPQISPYSLLSRTASRRLATPNRTFSL